MKCGESTNPLYPGQFGLVIESDKFKKVEYFCTKVNIPALSMTPTNQNFQNFEGFGFADQLKYGSLSIEFIIDEELKNYLEIHSWMERIQSENLRESYDAVVLIYNNRSQLVKQVRFKDLVPQSLGAIDLSSQDPPETPITCSVDFVYTGFSFE
jgi:hypothetical protein